jgi:hypothetical protein
VNSVHPAGGEVFQEGRSSSGPGFVIQTASVHDKPQKKKIEKEEDD